MLKHDVREAGTGWDEEKRRGGRIILGREQQVFALPWFAFSKGNAYTQLARQFLSTPENDWSHLASVMQFLPRAYTVRAPGPGSAQKLIISGSGSRGRAKEEEETTSSASWKRVRVRGAKPAYEGSIRKPSLSVRWKRKRVDNSDEEGNLLFNGEMIMSGYESLDRGGR